MKSSQSSKAINMNTLNNKPKKSSKDREKRKSQSSIDKNSPSKDNKQYAGISSDFINIHDEYLSEEVQETLAEDINYRLRHIIHDALIKARLSGRNVINYKDVDETFKNLSIENVYGATSSPNWVPLHEHNILYLDDAKLNLIELAEEENNYAQHGDMVLMKGWLLDLELDNTSPLLKNSFTKLCYASVHRDEYVRSEALRDISQNACMAPIIDWFYNFAYFLLLKDITYDCLTLHALNLIETLENSPIGSQNSSDKQLNLLVRLLLQRLIFSKNNNNIIKAMCSTLALLCLRYPLKRMAIIKLNHKLIGLQKSNLLPIVTAIYFLGIEAVQQIFLPNIDHFLECVSELGCPDTIYMVQAIYGLLCKAGCDESFVQHRFYRKFSYMLVPFWQHVYMKQSSEDTGQFDLNFCSMKIQLLKTRRHSTHLSICSQFDRFSSRVGIEQVFELPPNNCIVGKKLEDHRIVFCNYRKETCAVIGKTSILLSVIRQKRKKISHKCYGHTLSVNI